MVGMLGLLGMSRKMIAYSTIVWRVAVAVVDDDDDKQTFMFFLSLPFTRSS